MNTTSPMRSGTPAARPERDAGARTGTGRAHAKAILFGEHAVVYGAPAVAVPLCQLEVEAEVRSFPGAETRIESELFAGTLQAMPERLQPVATAARASLAEAGLGSTAVQLRIRSAVPHGRGLGSSAAVAAAVARATADFAGREFDTEQLYGIVQQAERVAHGNPSGIDARAVAARGPIRFQSGSTAELPIGAPLTFVIADSGVSGSTAEAVAGVRELRAAEPARIDRAISRLSDLAEGATLDLGLGDRAALGSRMREAHELLGRIGVSTTALDALVDAACAAGAAGAKLTGSGLGGCVLALVDSEEQAERIALTLRAAGAQRTWTTTVPVA